MAVRLSAAGLALLLLLNLLLYLRQPALTFFPQAALVETPAAWGLPFENVELTTSDGEVLHGWYLPGRSAARTLLFLHGNGGNISHRRDSLQIFHRLGLNVLIVDYRGYGRSSGTPSEAGLYRDATAAWRYLTEGRGLRGEEIVIFGRSLGGAVAVELASRVGPAALILESTFSSTADMAHEYFPLLSRLVWLRYAFDSEQRIGKLAVPLLLLHSPQDEIIPFRFGERLFAVAPGPKRFVELRGSHNAGFLQSQPRYEQVIRQFLDGLGPLAPPFRGLT